ncbi:MAG: rod shape-determining protein MreD [Bacteroidaceae bacterium]|nr:rod shape-determining protein MreD [Bacteroidaceae bacterium]
MIKLSFAHIGWFILLILLQGLVFNHLHFMGYATPMPYVFFLIILPTTTKRWVYIVLGFAMGLVIDLFSNTPGMTAASLCLTGLAIPPLLKPFLPNDHEDNETLTPSARSMEWGPFVRFAFLATLINTVCYFLLEAFSFFNWQHLLISISSSTFISLLFIISIEVIRSTKKK